MKIKCYKGYNIFKLKNGWISVPKLFTKYGKLEQAIKNIDQVVKGELNDRNQGSTCSRKK